MIQVKGAKAGQDKPRKPSIAKDSAASVSTVKILYGLAEGEVAGLVDGAKSIRLDGTPLVDDNGSNNFEGVNWAFRAGTNEQDYIQGFPDVSNETGIGVELKSSTPYVKAFTDTQISALRVRFKWDRLSKTNPENGDVKGYKIDYAIDLQTDGGAYQEVLRTKIEDKTSAGYERTHRIDLPRANAGWQLRIRRLTPNDTSEYVQDTMMIEAIAEVIDVKLSYPNTALLGLQYNAETFSRIAKLEVHMRGSIIRVPSNYNPVTRVYTGIWDGTFKDAYSNNPAWAFYFLCTQWRFGLGERLDATMIDKWSLYALGQYCDQMVSDGQGGLEPRFTCNVYLQKQEEAYKVLQNLAGIFRAMSYWNGERIVLDADMPQDPVFTFSRANVVDGSFEYTGTRNRDRHTLAKVAWDNPKNRFETEYEYVRDEKAMAKFGVKVLDLSAFGCTSQAQAQRAGLWALKTEQLETRQVSFSVGLDGFIPQVGNIINVSDELFAGRANGGRVSTVNATQRIIELDREVVAAVGDVLIINGANGKSERRNISNVVGNRITVTAGFTGAEPEHVWAIETVDLKLMRFRVMAMAQNDDTTFSITAIQHEPQKYDAIDFNIDVKPTDISVVSVETVEAPASVGITSRHRKAQAQTITTLIIGWTQVAGAVAYEVEWRKDDGTWIKMPRTGNTSAEVDGVYSGQYMARVRAVSAFDVQSNPTTSLLTEVKGKVGLPPKVLGFTATGVLFGVDFKWAFAQGSSDAACTEIEYGIAPSFDVKTIQVGYPSNTFSMSGLQGGLPVAARARLVDKLGFKSEWSDLAETYTDNSADKVMDLIEGQITETALSAGLGAEIAKIPAIVTGLIENGNKVDQLLIDAGGLIGTVDLLASKTANNEGLIENFRLAFSAFDQAYSVDKQTLQASIGAKGEIIYSTTAPAADKRLAQNLWVDTTGGKNVNKRWNGSTWVVVSDQTGIDLAKAKGETIYSSTAPAVDKRLPQNLWIDTASSKNTPKRWNGSAWVVVSDASVLDSISKSSLATYVRESGVFATEFGLLSGSIETNQQTIDGQTSSIEIINSIGNAEKLRIEIAKAEIAKNVEGVEAKRNQLTDLITSYTAKRTEATTKRNATSDVGLKAIYQGQIDVLTLAISETTAERNTLNARKVELQKNINELNSLKVTESLVKEQYTINIDSGGKVSGFGLIVDKTNNSAFDIRADRFSISAPAGKPNDVSGTSPFMVLTNPQTIDGVTVPAGVYARNFYAPKGSIDTLQVKDGAIKTAKIGSAQVDTLQIKGEAIIVPRVQFTEDDFSFRTIDTEEVINTITLDSDGGGVSISFGFEKIYAKAGGDNQGNTGKVNVRIKRGTKVLRTLALSMNGIDKHPDYAWADRWTLTERFITLPTILDTPPKGNQTYTVTLESRGLNSGKSSQDLADHPVVITARSFHIMGAKR